MAIDRLSDLAELVPADEAMRLRIPLLSSPTFLQQANSLMRLCRAEKERLRWAEAQLCWQVKQFYVGDGKRNSVAVAADIYGWLEQWGISKTDYYTNISLFERCCEAECHRQLALRDKPIHSPEDRDEIEEECAATISSRNPRLSYNTHVAAYTIADPQARRDLLREAELNDYSAKQVRVRVRELKGRAPRPEQTLDTHANWYGLLVDQVIRDRNGTNRPDDLVKLFLSQLLGKLSQQDRLFLLFDALNEYGVELATWLDLLDPKDDNAVVIDAVADPQ